MRTASAATSGVCSAGFATTVLPATSAALDLAEEDRERKIPRADADEDAAAAIAQLVALAGRPGQRLRGERAARLERVVAAEIDRLAHLRHRIVERLAALRLQQRDQAAAPRLQEIAGAVERGGARLDRRRRPGGESRLRRRHGGRRAARRRLRARGRSSRRRSANADARAAPATHAAVDERRRPRSGASPRGPAPSSASRLARSPNSTPAELRRSGA